MRKNAFVWAVAVSFVMAFAGAAHAADNWLGSWKANPAKSKSTNAISTASLKFEATADGIKLSTEGTDADGKPMKGSYTSKFDGKDVVWTGNPMADTAAPKRVDDNNYENVWKKDGKVTVTAKVTVSADGKMLTVTQEGVDAKGKAVHSVAVYDKQ
jgi:hypothetical protein